LKDLVDIAAKSTKVLVMLACKTDVETNVKVTREVWSAEKSASCRKE